MPEPTDTGWTAGWNMPGYLPETDPGTFDEWQDAMNYLVGAIDRFWDQDQESPRPMRNASANDPVTECCDRDVADCDCVDAKWLELHIQTGLATHGENWLYVNGDISLVFWVVRRDNTDHNIAGGDDE